MIFELSVQNLSDLTAQFGGLLNDALFGGAEFSLGGRPTLTSLVSAAISGTALSPGEGITAGSVYRNAAGDSGFVGFLSALTKETSAIT